MPSDGESFSELYYLTETDDGELIADDYPKNFVVGEARPIVLGIGNQEHERTNYTVVVELQNVTFGGPNGTTAMVHDQEVLSRFSTSLAHNGTRHRTVQLRPTMVGQDLRTTFFLYRGPAPDDPSAATAYRDTHLWVNVTRAGA